MKIILLGTGGALPPAGRAQTGIYIEKDDRALLVDCGAGILYQLANAGLDLEKIDTILISHHHLDHMSDLLPFITARWLAGYSSTRVIGPEGTAQLLHSWLNLHDYVNQHVSVDVNDIQPGDSFEAQGFKIDSMATEHWIPTIAFKFDGKFAYSADTSPINVMCQFAQGCEILLHECSSPNGAEMPFHTSPKELGELLTDCGVQKLVLTHFYPQSVGRESEMAQSIRRNFSGEVVVGQDLMKFEI